MLDAVKIAAKVALIAVITAAVLVLFANITIPSVDFSNFSRALGVGLAVAYHYVPASVVLFPVLVLILGLELSIVLFKFAMIAVRWVMKVNE